MTPERGDIIRHCTHAPDNGTWSEYRVDRIAGPGHMLSYPLTVLWVGQVKHYKTREILTIANVDGEFKILCPLWEYGQTHVIFSSTDNDDEVWACPLTDFLYPMEDGTMQFVKVDCALP